MKPLTNETARLLRLHLSVDHRATETARLRWKDGCGKPAAAALKFPAPRSPRPTDGLVFLIRAMRIYWAPLRDLYPPLVTVPPVPRPVVTPAESPLPLMTVTDLDLV